MIVLPRQAQDNHRENSKNKGCVFLQHEDPKLVKRCAGEEKTPFLAPFNLNVKDDLFAKTGSGRKETLKKRRFLQAAAGSAARA